MVVQKKILTREFNSKVMRYENGELVERAYTSNAGVLVGGTPGQIADTAYKPVAHTISLPAATKIGSFVKGEGIVVNAPEYALYGTQRVADESGVTIGGPIAPSLVLPQNMVVTVLTAGHVWVERGELETIKAKMNTKVIYEPDGDNEKDLCVVEVNGVIPPPPYWGLTFTANEPGVVVNMAKNGSPDPVTLEYCLGADDYTDDNNWTVFDADGGTTPITLVNTGDKVYFRAGSTGNTKISKSSSAYRTFTFTGSVSASGNIMSLLTQNKSDWQSVQMADFCYSYMFSGCTSLTSAPELPATTLKDYCYYYMFYGCSRLTSAPELPARTLANYCYGSMFYNCTLLSSVEVAFTAWNPSNATSNWLYGVASNGTFTCPEGLDTTTRNASHVPAGWTVVAKAA